MIKTTKRPPPDRQAYLMDLRDRVANQVMEALTAMELPDDVAHQHVLTSSLLGVASMLACGAAECDEKQFLEQAKEMFLQARMVLAADTVIKTATPVTPTRN